MERGVMQITQSIYGSQKEKTITCCMIPYSVMDFASGSGKRLFINGVGLEDGFVSECLPIFCL